MLDLIFEFFATWVGEQFSLNFFAARRARRYDRRSRVYFRGRVKGLPAIPTFTEYLAAQDGHVWVATRRRRGAELYPVPTPSSPSAIAEDSQTPAWSGERTLTYEVDGRRVWISTIDDWDLLNLVLRDATNARQATEGAKERC